MYVPWGQELRNKRRKRRRGEGEEEEAEEDTEVRTTTCHGIGRPSKKLIVYNVCVCGGYALGMRRETVAKTAWVCAGYAPRDCRFKPALGMRWGVCAQSGKHTGRPEYEIRRPSHAVTGLRR